MRLSTILAIIALLFFTSTAVPCAAQQDITARVDEYVNSEMQKARIPGLSLAVIKDGKIVMAKGYGLANVEHQVPVKPETIFQSGSMGKQFTATAVMMLVEEGKLNLNDPITKYFTDAPASWQKITIRHLLTHTAGTTDYPDDFDFRRDYTEAELLKRAEAIPLAFQPGDKWSYSNLGYVLLGILIHKVSGKFYGDFLQERVFKPLGMTTARIISEADIVPNRAAGYRITNGELKNQNWVSPSLNTTADGALYLTVYDMAKWDAALYTEKLLHRSSLEQMWTHVKLNNGKAEKYGFGWRLDDVRGHHLIEHGGSWQGFKSHIARYVDDKLTVVVFANLAQANPTTIAHGIAAIYDSELVPLPATAIERYKPCFTSWHSLRLNGVEKRKDLNAGKGTKPVPVQTTALAAVSQIQPLQQIIAAAKAKRESKKPAGISVLFVRANQAGVTAAADTVAQALGREIYRVNLSEIVSKYIGETEKNLQRVFAIAASRHAILFFDEADALFGKRTGVQDAHDRFANLEINYLLQQLEKYDGVAILATNQPDEIIERRVVRFRFVLRPC